MAETKTASIGPTPEERMFQEQLRGALIFQAKFRRLEHWRGYIRILAHNFYSGDTLKTDSPTINIVASRVRAQPPKLAFGVPSFDVKVLGHSPTKNTAAAIAEFLRMTWETERFDETTRRCTLDWPTFGIGIGFTGYENSADQQVLDTKRKLFGVFTPEFTEKASRIVPEKLVDIASAREERTWRVILDERIFLDRVSPFNFVLDPAADHWTDAQFMARRIWLPYERAKMMFGMNCPKPDKVGNVALYTNDGENDDPFGDYQDSDLASRMPDAVKRVAVWELWNITQKKTAYLNADDGRVIPGQVYDWRSPYPDFPFTPLIWDEIPDVVWPEGLAASIKPMNDELHEIRRRELAELGKAFNVIRVSPSAKRDTKEAVKNLKDGGIIYAEEGEVERMPATFLPPDAFQVEQRVKDDIDQVSHTTAYDAGSMPVVRRTATEASYAQSSSDAVAAYRKMAVERFAKEVAERTLSIAFATLDKPITLRINNEDETYTDPLTGMLVPLGQPIDFDFIPTAHICHVSIKTIEDTMMAMAKDVERQQLMQAFELFSPFDWFKSRECAAHILSSMSSVRDPYKFVEESDAPQQPASQPGLPDMQGQMGAGAMPVGALPQAGGLEGTGNMGQGSGNVQADVLAGLFGGMAPQPGGIALPSAPAE